jgi:hypothetical protein
MANLVSPGVQVQIIDESFYAGAGEGTVPFIMLATAQDKGQPGNTTAIAPGTVKANAGKLYNITSQRELIQTFGNPRFTTQAGTPQYGSELNEWGLYAAYQYLGLANRAFVMRADVDLAALESTTLPPAGEPRNGSLWLDTANTSWGVFRSNGNINSSLAWGAIRPIVIDNAAQLELSVQGLTASPILDPNADLLETGTLVILPFNLQVSVVGTDSLLDVVQKINSAVAASTNNAVKVLRAEVAERVFAYETGLTPVTQAATVYNLRLVCANVDLEAGLSLTGSTPGVLTALGMSATPANQIMPVLSLGSVGSVAVNAYKSRNSLNELVEQVQMFEKILVTTANTTQARWFLVGSTDAQAPGAGWTEATPTVVTGTDRTPTIVAGHESEITIGATTFTFTNSASTLPDLVTQLNTEFATNNAQAVASIFTQGPDAYLRITNYAGTTVQLVDTVGGLFDGVGISQAQTFYGDVTGTADVAALPNPAFVENTKLTITVGTVTGEGVTATITAPSSGYTPAEFVTAINANNTINTFIEASLVTVGAETRFRIRSKQGTFFTLRNGVNAVAVAPFTTLAGIPCAATLGNTLVYQGYTQQQPQPKAVDQIVAGNIWINTNSGNRGSAWSVKRYNAGTDTWQVRSAPLYQDDASANTAYGGQRTQGSLYVQFNSNGHTPSTGTLVVKAWNGTAWVAAHSYTINNQPVPYAQSATPPRAQPPAGALWFNQDLRVDVMVSDGTQWMGYRNMYNATDPNGVILSATEPSTQSDGFTPLVDQDLWIDTSDLENYPKMYRYDSLNALWTLIDVTDQTTSQGIVFADVRPNNNGESNGSEAIADMLVSDYVDPDAPSALSYPFGMLVFNMRYSTNNVKVWTPNYFPTADWKDRWVTASGVAPNGTPYMGRKAQRRMVVQAMQAAIVSNQDIRAEGNFFNLLAAPGYAELIDELVTLNTDKKDVAFVLIDPPARLMPDGTSIQAWALNQNNAATNGEDGLITRSRYAGVYYPWGLATNLDGSEVFVPPSVAVLRTFAFNDQVSYPWFAPAGLNRGLISVFTSVGYLNGENEYVPVQLSQGQSDVLYQNDVNPIRFIPGRGLVIYGQKTLSPVESALNRVNVSRLVNYLNYQLDNLAKPFLFEPNDQYTRDAVQRTFESFMGDLVALRAVFDFAVLCDESNNTPDRIDRNELWIDIAVKPVKAVEFIYIPVRILNTGDPLPT